MESILTSIKKLLGIEEDYTQFDVDIIMHINTVLMSLNQMGIGPVEGFSISDKIPTWATYLNTATNLEAVKSYIYFKVRLMFDPPSSSFVLDSMGRQINELEWRLMVQAEPAPTTPEGGT